MATVGGQGAVGVRVRGPAAGRALLPPLLDQYGGALRIVAVNVDTGQGQALYQAVALHFRLPRQRLGVPALVVGEEILVGAWEIPSRLPGLVEAGLAGTGVDWPPIPAVRSFLTLQGLAAGASAATPAAARVRRPGGSRQDLQPHHIDAFAGHLADAQSDVAEVHRAVDGDLVGR